MSSFNKNMNKIQKFRTYLTSPQKCFIPKCKAHCCINAPLPEDFLPTMQSRIQRRIYSSVNIGQNDLRDKFNSVIYNTTPSPIQVLGVDQNGNKVLGIPKEVIEQLQIKSKEQIAALVEQYNEYKNYCPFITDYARCAVYEHRPPICREFGSSPLKIDQCPEKASRLDIMKFFVKEFFNFKRTFQFAKESLKAKFSKA